MYQLPATNSLVSCRNTTYSLVQYTLYQELVWNRQVIEYGLCCKTM